MKNICSDNKLRKFYFKLLHRIVVTKRELFTYGIAENAICPYCKQNDSIIHTFCNCHWTKWFFSEVIKWFNVENATSFAPSSSELIFGLNNDRKNQSSSAIVKKLDFTLLFAKYYLYINKLAPKDLSLDEFKAKVSWSYDFEKPLPSITAVASQNPTYRNNLLINRSNITVQIITTAVQFSFQLTISQYSPNH